MAYIQSLPIAKVSSSVVSAPEPNNYTNRYALISLGNTTKNQGTLTYYGSLQDLTTSLVNTTNELYQQAVNFFSNSTSQGVYVFESGNPAISSPATSAVATCLTPAALTVFETLTTGAFGITVNGTAYQITGIDTTADTTYAEIASTIQSAITNAGAGAFLTCSYSGTVFVFTNLTTGSTSTISALLTPTGTGTDITGSGYLNGASASLVQGVNATYNYVACISNYANYLTANLDTVRGGNAVFMTVAPQEWFSETTFQTLVKSYSNDSVSLVNFIVSTTNVNVTSDTNYTAYANLNNVMISFISISPNSVIYDTASAIAGTFAQVYNITNFLNATRIMPCASNLTVANVYGATMSLGQRNTLNSNYCVWVAQQFSNSTKFITQNAVMQNGVTFDDIFSAASVNIEVQSAIDNAIITANNSNTPIAYNNNGINTLFNIMNATLNKFIGSNVLESYSSSYILFNTYIEDNPSDYSQGIYNGFSYNADTGTFVFGVNIGANYSVQSLT